MIVRKVFLFGQNGFIGTHIYNFLKKKKNIKIIQNISFIRKKKFTQKYYSKYWSKVVNKCDTVVYLSFNNDLDDLRKNPRISFIETLHPLYMLCEVLRNTKKEFKIIYLSTASLYGNNVKLPVNEKSNIELYNIYEKLKYFSEQILINSKIKNLNYNILRLSNVYGENISNRKQSNRQVLTKVIENAICNKEIKVFGSGNYYRDFVHVKDVCQVINKLIARIKIKNEIFNIGSGKKLKLASIFKKIKSIVFKNYGILVKIKKKKLKNSNVDKSDIRNFQASISKIETNLNWKPKIKFTVGLRNLVEFIYEKKN